MSRRLFYGPKDARVLLVGQAPSRSTEGRPQLTLVVPDLARISGVHCPLAWSRLFARANLLARYPGRRPSGKGDRLPTGEAQRGAHDLRPVLGRFALVVLLGRSVEKAFGLRRVEWFEKRSALGTQVAVAPHPSRVSHWWNDEDNRQAARAFWRGVARRAGWTRS